MNREGWSIENRSSSVAPTLLMQICLQQFDCSVVGGAPAVWPGANIYVEALIDDGIDLPDGLPSVKKSVGLRRRRR
jgi:hypothetical protein